MNGLCYWERWRILRIKISNVCVSLFLKLCFTETVGSFIHLCQNKVQKISWSHYNLTWYGCFLSFFVFRFNVLLDRCYATASPFHINTTFYDLFIGWVSWLQRCEWYSEIMEWNDSVMRKNPNIICRDLGTLSIQKCHQQFLTCDRTHLPSRCVSDDTCKCFHVCFGLCIWQCLKGQESMIVFSGNQAHAKPKQVENWRMPTCPLPGVIVMVRQ